MGWTEYTAYFGTGEVLIKSLLRDFPTAEQLETNCHMGVK
jgi:hypothetical protein